MHVFFEPTKRTQRLRNKLHQPRQKPQKSQFKRKRREFFHIPISAAFNPMHHRNQHQHTETNKKLNGHDQNEHIVNFLARKNAISHTETHRKHRERIKTGG